MPVVSSDVLSLVVGTGGAVSGSGAYGDGLTSVAKNGTSLLIVGGGGSAFSASGSPGTYVAGNGGVVNGGDASYYDTHNGNVADGGGAQGATPGIVRHSGGTCTGGSGYVNGGSGAGASGGASSYFNASLLYERTQPHTTLI